MIGMVQIVETPGICTALVISPRSFSIVMPAGHWSRGFRCTSVSVMFSGEGSVDVSARPTLATTVSTSGNASIAAFCRSAMRVFSASEMLGSAIGMNSKSPSSSGGMNSLPTRMPTPTAPAKNTTATSIVSARRRSAHDNAGS